MNENTSFTRSDEVRHAPAGEVGEAQENGGTSRVGPVGRRPTATRTARTRDGRRRDAVEASEEARRAERGLEVACERLRRR